MDESDIIGHWSQWNAGKRPDGGSPGLLPNERSSDGILKKSISGKREETVFKIGKLGPDIVVIILPPITDVDGCESGREKAFAVNAEGMKHVALAALRCQAKVVYLSTDYVFDGNKREPYLEERSSPSSECLWSFQIEGRAICARLVKDGLMSEPNGSTGDMGIILLPPFCIRRERREFFRLWMTRSGHPPTRSISQRFPCLIRI